MEGQAEQKSSFFSKSRDNPWMVSTLVLGVLFLLAIIFTVSGNSFTGSVVSQDDATQKVLTFLNSQVQDGSVTLDSVTKESGLYKITVTYNGQQIPIYATTDGKNIVSDLVPLSGTGSTGTTGTTTTTGQKVSVDVGNAPMMGNADAPITIVEFSDFQCPFCERFFTETLPMIENTYVKTGKAKIYFMQFPLSFHDQAQKAAEASLCARDQKGDTGFWAMHDKMFQNQASLSVDNEKKWAREIGLDGAKFDSCLDSGKFAAQVASEEAYGQTLGVSGTPAFFINGVPLTGAQPFSAFQQTIDAELAAQ